MLYGRDTKGKGTDWTSWNPPPRVFFFFFAQDMCIVYLGASPHLWVHITIISYLDSTSWIFFIFLLNPSPPTQKQGHFETPIGLYACKRLVESGFVKHLNSPDLLTQEIQCSTHPNDPNGWVGGLRMLSRYVILYYVHPNHICCGENSYLSLHLHVLGETHTYPLSCSRLCHTSKGHHVAHDLGSQHTTLNAKRGDTYSLPIKNY